jgi:tRNA(His) guanylyltransferase
MEQTELSLGDRHKQLEKDFEIRAKLTDYIVVRLDGHKFSKYTKGFAKPFDDILSAAMQYATEGLVDKFGAVTGYTQSDEITLIFAPQWRMNGDEVQNNQVFAGRLGKLTSLSASYASTCFNKFLTEWYYSSAASRLSLEKVKDKIGLATFDSRAYGVDSKEEAFNAVMWRVRDALKNSYSQFAQAYCPHKELLKKTGIEQISYCLETTCNDWNDIKDKYKYGIFVKRTMYNKFLDDGSSVVRTKQTSWSERITTFNPEDVDLICRKYKTVVENTNE